MVPKLRQITEYSCAAAAFQAAIATMGIVANQEELMILMGTRPSVGTSSSGIVAACNHYNIPYAYKTYWELEELHTLLDQGKQVVAAVQLWGESEFPHLRPGLFDSGHYITLMKVTDTHVYFMDPFVARYLKLSRDEFLIRWHNEFANRYTEQMAIALL